MSGPEIGAVSSDDETIALVAYGSLMSGLGLLPFGHLSVRGLARVVLVNGRRGFGKRSRHGDRYAMVLEASRQDEPLIARAVPEGSTVEAGPGALLFELALPDLMRISAREGYRPEVIRSLAGLARAEGTALSGLLWTLFASSGYDTAAYRARLFRLAGYTSAHYVPHPVLLDDGGRALAFLPPGPEGSGSPEIVPVRVADGMTTLLSLTETWALRGTPDQLDYFAMCLLAEEHGVSVADVRQGVEETPALALALEQRLALDRPFEAERFHGVLGGRRLADARPHA